MRLLTLFTLVLLAVTSCIRINEDDDVVVPTEPPKVGATGEILDMPYLWKAAITKDDRRNAIVSPAIYNNTVVLSGNDVAKGTKDVLIAFDLETGEEKWRWDDFYTLGGSRSLSNGIYEINQKDNIWLLEDSPEYYAIDLETGETIWREKRGKGYFDFAPRIYKDHFYQPYALWVDSIYVPTLMRGNIRTGEIDSVVSPPIDQIFKWNDIYGNINAPLLFEDNGVDYALLQYATYIDVFKSEAKNMVALYNLTERKFEFSDLQIGELSGKPFGQNPIRHKDLIFTNPGNYFAAVNWKTGEIVWERTLNGRASFDVYEDRLYLVNEFGSGRYVYCLVIENGSEVWSDTDLRRGGAAEQIHFLNDVMYWNSRGSGTIFGYDTNTGEMLLNLKSPEPASFDIWAGFRVVPGKDGEKGKIIAATPFNVYCYEALR